MPTTAVTVVSAAVKGLFGNCKLAGNLVSLKGVGGTFHSLPRNCAGISTLRLHSDNSNWPLDGKKSGADTNAYAAMVLRLNVRNSGNSTTTQPSPV